MQNQNEETKTAKPAKLTKILIKTIVFLMIIFLLYLILVPSLPDERVSAKIIICKSHLKGVALALRLYAEDNNSHLPTHEKWNDLLTPYHRNNKILRCPSDKTKGDNICTYILNNNIKNLKPPTPSDLVLAFEGPTGWNQSGGPEMMVFKHRDNTKCNVLLADATVIEVNEAEAKKLKWKP